MAQKEIHKGSHALHSPKEDSWELIQAKMGLSRAPLTNRLLESWGASNLTWVGELNGVTQRVQHAEPALHQSLAWHITQNLLEIDVFLWQ